MAIMGLGLDCGCGGAGGEMGEGWDGVASIKRDELD